MRPRLLARSIGWNGHADDTEQGEYGEGPLHAEVFARSHRARSPKKGVPPSAIAFVGALHGTVPKFRRGFFGP
jgi:hypothetical protein